MLMDGMPKEVDDILVCVGLDFAAMLVMNVADEVVTVGSENDIEAVISEVC